MSPVPAPLPGPVPADPEVVARPERRMDTAEYQRRLLTQADAATEKGDRAQLLRREGLYAAPLAGWRGERESALAKALTPKRGPEPSGNPRAGEKERRRQPNQP